MKKQNNNPQKTYVAPTSMTQKLMGTTMCAILFFTIGYSQVSRFKNQTGKPVSGISKEYLPGDRKNT